MLRLSIRVDGPPVAQPRPRFSAVVTPAEQLAAAAERRQPRAMPRARLADQGHPIHAFRTAVQLQARTAFRGPALAGPVKLAIAFHFAGSGKAPSWHAKRPDIDNLAKGVMDALLGIAYLDDSQVCAIEQIKVCIPAGAKPGVIVDLFELQEKPPWPFQRLTGVTSSYATQFAPPTSTDRQA